MGSGGSHRFTDYPGKPPAAGSGTPGGTSSGGDPCSRTRNNVPLEEVARCAYYEENDEVPPLGTDVIVLAELADGRIAVATESEGTVIGYLPTEHNDLASCLSTHRYSGEVVTSSEEPVPRVVVTISPLS